MDFDWNDANISHIARHRITREEAEQVIRNQPLDTPAVYRGGELRTAHLGETDAGRILIVVITERDGMYRVVTARPTKRKERAFYTKWKAEKNAQDSTDP